MSVTPRILYNLHQQLIESKQDQYQRVLNNYLEAHLNNYPNLAFNLGNKKEPVIFTDLSRAAFIDIGNKAQENTPDEINKSKPPTKP